MRCLRVFGYALHPKGLVTMNRVFIGLGILALLLLYQWGTSRMRMSRLKREWETALRAFKDKDLETAQKSLQRCVRLMPMWTPARFMLGGVLAKRGRLADAEAQLKLGADLEPRSPEGHLQLGMFYVVCHPDRAGEAIAALERAAACDPALREQFANAPGLEAIRSHPRFQQLIGHADS